MLPGFPEYSHRLFYKKNFFELIGTVKNTIFAF